MTTTFIAWRSWRRGDRLPSYGILWFTIVIGPVLPLRDHFMEYYLAVPAIGLALLVAGALCGFLGVYVVLRRVVFVSAALTQLSTLGVIVALTFIGLPFVVRTLQPALEELDAEAEEAAYSLGANRWQAFWRAIPTGAPCPRPSRRSCLTGSSR